jgi:hypothetical protein
MTTQIETDGPPTGVSTALTASRVTPPPARPFREVMGAGTAAVATGAEQAVRSLPGGPILAAALRAVPGASGSVVGSGATGLRPEGSTGTAQSAGTGGIEGALAENSDRTLDYLELQERIAAESQTYSALSNVLKARHDTIKNAIGNIR